MRSLLVLLILAALCPAQRAQPINGIRAWKGTVSLKAKATGKISYASGSLTTTEDWEIDSEGSMQIKVAWTDKGAWYLGSVEEGRARVMQRHTTTGGSPVRVTTLTWTGQADLGPTGGKKREYAIGVERSGFYFLNLGSSIPLLNSRPGNTFTNNHPWDHGQIGLHLEALPAAGVRQLRGSFRAKGTAYFLLHGNVEPEFEWTVDYNLVPDEPAEEVEVIVSSASYAAWRPTAGPDGAQGSTLPWKAVLQKKGGGEPATARARVFKWSFANMSNEPGFALNSRNTDRTPDMRFLASPQFLPAGAEAQSGETPAGRWLSSEATVASFDWGGYGVMRVAAELEDGRVVEGALIDSGDTAILLPKRSGPADPIAKIWREAFEVGGKPAAADDENTPVGDGNKGDGLTLYEEYRGFLENGRHVEGSPARKDLFVFNQSQAFVAGIRLFAQLSELEVHFELTAEEAGATRVINRNFGAAPHAVDQHLIVVTAGSSNRKTASAIGGPGNPVQITHVIVPAFTGDEPASLLAAMPAIIAHELFHAVNVWHHGDNGDRQVHWVQRDGEIFETALNNQGRPVGAEKKITVLTEDGLPALLHIPSGGVEIYLGEPLGPHSGAHDCVMRYESAEAYPSRLAPNVRYRIYEQRGGQLCRTGAGTGVNDAGRTPQSRYGDAAPNRGDCAHQILVNDAVRAPKRF